MLLYNAEFKHHMLQHEKLATAENEKMDDDAKFIKMIFGETRTWKKKGKQKFLPLSKDQQYVLVGPFTHNRTLLCLAKTFSLRDVLVQGSPSFWRRSEKLLQPRVKLWL